MSEESTEKKFNWLDIGYVKETKKGHTVLVINKEVQIIKGGQALDLGEFRNKIYAFKPNEDDNYASENNIKRRLKLDVRD